MRSVIDRVLDGDERQTILADLNDLTNGLLRRRSVDWKLLERFLDITHDDHLYQPPFGDQRWLLALFNVQRAADRARCEFSCGDREVRPG